MRDRAGEGGSDVHGDQGDASGNGEYQALSRPGALRSLRGREGAGGRSGVARGRNVGAGRGPR